MWMNDLHRALIRTSMLVFLVGGVLGCGENPNLVVSTTVQPSPPRRPSSHAPSTFDFRKIKSIAVLPLVSAPKPVIRRIPTHNRATPYMDDRTFPLPNNGQYVQKTVENTFLDTPFRVLERASIQRILEEHDFQISQGIDDSHRASKAGKLLAADAVIYGTVQHFHYDMAYSVRPNGSYVAVSVPIVAFTLKMVEVKSGRIIWACTCYDTGRRFLKAPYTVSNYDLYRGGLTKACEPLGSVHSLTGVLVAECRDEINALVGRSPNPPQ